MNQSDIFSFLYQPYKITKPIRLIELFAGIGSQAMALRDLGVSFEHYRVAEIDRFAIKAYNAIHGTDFKPLDITQLHGDDLGITSKDQYEYIITYSFPCQDLSAAGKRAGMSKGSGTRSGLLWEVERILKELNDTDSLPQVLLMENEPDVIGTKNIKDFNEWYAFLESIGYQSYYKILNAKDYGVPQNRNRCFMISILGDYSYMFPDSVLLEKRLRDVLESEVDEKYYLSDEYVVNFLQRSEQQKSKGNGHLFKPKTENDISNAITTRQRGSLDDSYVMQIGNCLPTHRRDNPNQGRIYASEGISPSLNCMEGGNRQPMIISENTVKGYAEAYIGVVQKGMIQTLKTSCNDVGVVIGSTQKNAYKGSLDGCCPTLTQAMGTGGGQIPMINSEYRIRKLSPLECWRLMDYSDEDFYKAQSVNSNTQLYKQAGNGIVKAVLMAIFKEMI